MNVLPDAGAFDVALVDGDHNWYTVYNSSGCCARRLGANGDRFLC